MLRSRLPNALCSGFGLTLAAAVIALAVPQSTAAAGGKQLQRVRGTVGYATVADAADFKAVFGKFELPDADFAVTRSRSAAVLAMPDSSLISLGENTNVAVGAFDSSANGPGATITINGGAMRFDIKRPQGGAANYHFVTPTSQTAVRGTIGLISFLNGVTTVGCIVCAADSVVVSTATQTVALVTGQFVTVSALGAVTTGALSGAVGAFSGAGVPVSAETGAAAAGLPAGAAAVNAVIPIAAGAAAAGVTAGVITSQGTPNPQQTISVPGSVQLTGHGAGRPGR